MVSEKKILIVEADPSLSDEWANGLRDYGFKVAVTGDGEDGFSKAEKNRPDLVMLRAELPNGVNGYKLAKRFKEHDQLKEVPLVVLSSEASEKDFEALKKTKSRAQVYRRLPVVFDDLLEDVEELVGLPVHDLAEFQAEAVPAEKYNELEAKRAELLLEVDRLKEGFDSKSQSEARLEERLRQMEKDLSEKAGAAAQSLTAEIDSLRTELTAIKEERDEARNEVDSKKRALNKLRENIAKLEGDAAKVPDLEAKAAELVETKEELESKKKVVAKLKEKITQLENTTAPTEALEALRREKEDLEADLEGKKKVISKLRESITSTEAELERVNTEKKDNQEELEAKRKSYGRLKDRIESLEAENAKIKETIAGYKETIADQTISVDESRRALAKATAARDEALEAKAHIEKTHQKELDQLKGYYEPKVAALKASEKELDAAKDKIRDLDKRLDEEGRKNRDRDDAYAEKLEQFKRENSSSLREKEKVIEELKRQMAEIDEEKRKAEEKQVATYQKLRNAEKQLDKVNEALEVVKKLAKLSSSGSSDEPLTPKKKTSV